MKKFAYDVKIVIEPDDNNSYYAHCPGLSGVFACGKTEEEALINAKDATISILRTKLSLGESIRENENLKVAPTSQNKANKSISYETQISFPLTVSL